MSQTRVCPVCGRPGLPPNCASCPQCDADLTCFQALDSLASPAAATAAAPPKRRFPWAVAAGLALIAMLLLAGLAASMKSRLSDLDRQLAELKAAEQKAAAANRQKQEPQPQLAAAENAAEQAKPKLPPESKIQIDARVRIIDEREAEQTASKQAAEKPKQPVIAAREMKHPVADIAAKPAEERKLIADVQPAAPVKQQAQAAPPKVVSEAIRQPDEDKEEPIGAAMPPLPTTQTAEQQQSAAAQEKTAEEQKPASSSVSSDSPEKSEKTELAADLPETPPVLLKPGYRKHRVPPAPHHAAAENTAQTPAAGDSPTASQTAPQSPSGTFSYVVKDGETAWDIAGRFYGDRKYYPVVMEQNPHIFLGFVRKNSAVRLFADRREAAALYQRNIEQRDGLLLWKYEVRPGETWRSIYARFFLPRYSGMIFYGDQDVAPGKTVRIILR